MKQLAGVGLTLMLLLSGCRRAEGHDAGVARTPEPDVTSPDFVSPELPHARIAIPDAFGGVARVDAEVAASEPMRRRGLMWRSRLDDGQGMLFVFPAPSTHGFWMKNTLIALDMLFIGSDGRVVGIVEGAEPRSLESRGVGSPSLYVLEVPGGWVQRRGVRPGVHVSMDGWTLGAPSSD